MNKLIVLIVVAAFMNHYNPSLFNFIWQKDGAFNPSGTARALLFVHDECGAPCSAALEHLKSKSIKPEIIDLKDNPEGRKQLQQFVDSTMLPVLVVGNNIYSGFNARSYNEYLYEIKGDSVFSWRDKRVYKQHFDEFNQPKVVIYSRRGCSRCSDLRDSFDSYGIEYIEWNIHNNSEAKTRHSILAKAYGGSSDALLYVGTRRIEAFEVGGVLQAIEDLM
ncbi:glutaredoxin domain-containing protein [Moritella sp. F3]|uniref:glutaredoxin domain-containing protein n=1 Tax=Moritella sp. F3 TaxID=2718882 RepID=UPI0018E1BFBA|nr:glutaredoxin domain-containing protein [Moritella sp. F3]GIC75733.1 hypothetical protein FMO001_04600 [Moritella sp. F1]GIC81819.1 hypothetical protein FMO003_21000 [Moritella sp. F3]